MRKIRIVGYNKNLRGDSWITYGISIPQEIANSFKDVKFFIQTTDNSITFKSGAEIPDGKRKFRDLVMQ